MREFTFEIQEIETSLISKHKLVVSHTIGNVYVNNDGEVTVYIEDPNQNAVFTSKDSFFNKIIKKIHEATRP